MEWNNSAYDCIVNNSHNKEHPSLVLLEKLGHELVEHQLHMPGLQVQFPSTTFKLFWLDRIYRERLLSFGSPGGLLLVRRDSASLDWPYDLLRAFVYDEIYQEICLCTPMAFFVFSFLIMWWTRDTRSYFLWRSLLLRLLWVAGRNLFNKTFSHIIGYLNFSEAMPWILFHSQLCFSSLFCSICASTTPWQWNVVLCLHRVITLCNNWLCPKTQRQVYLYLAKELFYFTSPYYGPSTLSSLISSLSLLLYILTHYFLKEYSSLIAEWRFLARCPCSWSETLTGVPCWLV